jgi:hypothetical protein
MYLPSKGMLVFVGCLTGIAVFRAKRPGVMTPERDKLYRRCLSGNIRDSGELRRIADDFQKARLFPQAQLLRQRADLRDLPPEIKARRRATFRKGMASKNKLAVLKLADAFDGQGCTTAAHKLRLYGSGLPDLDQRSFDSSETSGSQAIVTPPAAEESSDPGESAEPEREKRDTEPAPKEEAPNPFGGEPETEIGREPRPEPGPNPKSNGAGSAHAAA